MAVNRPEVGDRVVAAEAVVAQALQAFENQDWPQLLDLTDAGSVETLKGQYLQRKRTMMSQQMSMSADALESSDVPEEFKEYLRSRKAFGELAGITTMEEAEALKCDEFLTRWAQARHPHFLVDGVAPWHTSEMLLQRQVVGSIAVLPDTVAVMVRVTNTVALNALGAHSLIAVLGDNAGGWALDAANSWLGLADMYA